MAIDDFHVRIKVKRPSLPFHYYYAVQTVQFDSTIVDPDFPTATVSDFVIQWTEVNVPTCDGNSPTDLTIRTNVGSAIVNDDYAVTADPDDKKFIKMVVVRDDTSGLLEILAFEKTLGDYADIPAGKSHEKDLKEFSVVALGTALVEEEDFI